MLVADSLALIRGGRLLFDALSFTLAAGEALVVTGPNGAGKSSLLRLVAGLLAPNGGRLDNPYATGLLAGEPALKAHRRLAAELGFWRRLDAGAQGLAAAVAAAAGDVGLAPLLDLPVAMLSSGQRQRAALARLLLQDAQLWLLDEPTNALDGAAAAQLHRLIARHRAAGGLVIAATHQPLDLADARQLALGG